MRELKPCLMALQDSAVAAEAQNEAELKRIAICEERAAALHSAAATMKRVGAEELRNNQIEISYPIDVRIGVAIRKSKQPLEAIIKKWPGAHVGYATREAVGEGVRALGVRVTDESELDKWYQTCFEAGLAESICRPNGGICLKRDLTTALALAKKEHALAIKREAALRESKRLAMEEQDAIHVKERTMAKQWAAQGAAALKAHAEKVAAQEVAARAKREAAAQRKELEKRRIEEKRRAMADEQVNDSSERRVYNQRFKSSELGLRRGSASKAPK